MSAANPKQVAWTVMITGKQLEPKSSLTKMIVILKELIENLHQKFEKNLQTAKPEINFPACKELDSISVMYDV